MKIRVTVCAPKKGCKNYRLVAKRGKGRGRKAWRKEISASTDDEALAKSRAMEWEIALNTTSEGQLTAGELCAQFLAQRQAEADAGAEDAVRESTLSRYRWCFKRLGALSALPAADWTAETTAELVDLLRAGGLAGSTIKTTLYSVKAAFAWGASRGMSPDWPGGDGGLKPKDTHKRPFEAWQVKAVMDWVREHRPNWEPVFQAIANTGLRSGQVCRLMGEDVVRTGRTGIYVRKFKSSPARWVGLDAETVRRLPDAQQGEPIFRAPRGGPVSVHTIGNVMRDALKSLDWPDRRQFDVHSLRRRWIHDAHTEAGVPVKVSQSVVGHASVEQHMSYMRGAKVRGQSEAVQATREIWETAVPPEADGQETEELEGEVEVPQTSTKTRRKPLQAKANTCRCRTDPSGGQVAAVAGITNTSRANLPPPTAPISLQQPSTASRPWWKNSHRSVVELVEVVRRWRDEDAEALRLLVEDPVVGALVLSEVEGA